MADFIFLDSKITMDGDCSQENTRRVLLGRKAMTNLDGVLKSRDIPLPAKVCISQSYGFSTIHVWMWELDHQECWAPKTWCFQTVVLEKIFPTSWFFTSGGQIIGASATVLPMNIQSWFPLGLNNLISLHSKGLSRVFSSTTSLNQFFGAQPSIQPNSHIHTWLLEKP